MHHIINLVFLPKSDILRASDFPISSHLLSFFLLSVPFFSSSFFFANAAAYQEWAYSITYFEYFPCDVELWSTINALKFVLHYEKMKWIKILP